MTTNQDNIGGNRKYYQTDQCNTVTSKKNIIDGKIELVQKNMPHICHRHYRWCLWRKNLSCGEVSEKSVANAKEEIEKLSTRKRKKDKKQMKDNKGNTNRIITCRRYK